MTDLHERSEPLGQNPIADHDARVRLQDGEKVIFALRRTSWQAMLEKVLTLGLYWFWWRVAWFVVTDRRLVAKPGSTV